MGYKDIEFKYKLKKTYRTVLIIILLILIALLCKLQMDNVVYSRYEIQNRLERVGSEDSKYRNYNGNLLCYSMDGVSAYDKNGNQLWNQTFQMQNEMVSNAGDYVIAADYQGTCVYLIGKSGLIKTIETNLPVLSVDVSAQGIAIVQLREGDTVYMELYDKEGQPVTTFRTTMRNFGFPLAYGISQDSVKMGVSYLKAAAGKVKTSLAFYNFGGVGQNETDNLVSAYECEDEVVPTLAFPSQDTILTVGSKKVRIFMGKQKPELQTEMETEQEIHAVFYSQNYFVLVYDAAESSGKYEFCVYDMNGNEKMKTAVDFEYTDVIVEDNRLIAYNQNRMLIAGYNGVVKYNDELSGGVQEILPLDKYSRFLFVYPDKMEKVRLR